MSACNFSIAFTENATDLVNKANKGIANAGGKFNGDNTKGNFTIETPLGEIIGSYTVQNQTFNIDISKKPFFVSCNKIENELRKFM